MESLDISPQFKTSSLSVPSPTATHVACLSGARLQIRCLASFEITRSIPLPSSHDLRTSRIAWSPPPIPPPTATSTPPRRTPSTQSHRVLIADEDTARVYDLRDDKWSAIISNGSGGMGKIVHISFGQMEDEVVMFSDFASKATVWCLKTGRTVEIRDPKFSGKEGKGWGYRPASPATAGEAWVGVAGRGEVLAILCRSAGQDVLLLLAPQTYSLLKRVELPTVDAQGLKWSRDGRWLAIWDAASSGYKLCIYTADGHLYRAISREPSNESSEWGIEGLGIKTVEWIPSSEWLAVGGWDRRVRILSTRTFSPVVFLDHTSQIHIPTTPVYTEQVDGQGQRRYEATQQPVTPPKALSEKNDTGLIKQGISALAFNQEGTLCATRDDLTPTTVWIWDLRSLKPRTILIQHSPVKTLHWHASNPSLLLIQTVHESPTLYFYTTTSLSASAMPSSAFTPSPPEILSLSTHITKPAGSLPAKWTASWLPTHPEKRPVLSLSHQQGYILVWPEGKDQILRFEGQEGDESDDSLYDILTGRTPVPPLYENSGRESEGNSGNSGSSGFEAVDVGVEDYEESTGSFEDTFRERKVKAVAGETRGGRGRSMFDESGLDEMF